MDQRSVYSRSSHRSRRRRRHRRAPSDGESVRSFSSTSTVAVTEYKLHELNKWQSLCKGLWFAVIVEANPSANKQSVIGFFDAMDWLRNREISESEFNSLYDAWVEEGRTQIAVNKGISQQEPSLAWYRITESDILVNSDVFRDVLIRRKYETKDLEVFSKLLNKQVNRKEVKKGYYTEGWLLLIESLFYSLDVNKSGLLSIDNVMFLCLAQNPEKYILYNDRRQQIEQGLSRLSMSTSQRPDWGFESDLTTDVLLKLAHDSFEMLRTFGARESPLGTPYRGVVTLFSFKQQLKRLSSKHNKSNPFSEFKIQQMMAKLYSLRHSLSKSVEDESERMSVSSRIRRHRRSRMRNLDVFSMWEESIASNTMGSNENSIKLCMFLCHKGSLIRWNKHDRDDTWRSKKQIHHMWVAFKEEKQIFSSAVSDNLFLQLENTIQHYISNIIQRILSRRREHKTIPEKEHIQMDSPRSQWNGSAFGMPSVRTYRSHHELGSQEPYNNDDAISLGGASARTANTYNNFNLNLVNELQKLNFAGSESVTGAGSGTLMNGTNHINSMPRSDGRSKKVFESSFARDYNERAKPNTGSEVENTDGVILSGRYFDVLKQLSNDQKNFNRVRRSTLDFREAEVTGVMNDLVDRNSKAEHVLNKSSLINGNPNPTEEEVIDRAIESYTHLAQDNSFEEAELIIHSGVLLLKTGETWGKRKITLSVNKLQNGKRATEVFFIQIGSIEANEKNSTESVSLLEASVRPILVANYDKFKNLNHRFCLIVGDRRFEFSCSKSSQQTYWIRLLCFGISTSRTNALLERQQNQLIPQSVRTQRQLDEFSDINTMNTLQIDQDNTNSTMNDFADYERDQYDPYGFDTKSVRSFKSGRSQTSQRSGYHTSNQSRLNVPRRTAPATPVPRTVDTPISTTYNANFSADVHEQNGGALDRLAQAAAQLRQALSNDE